eukprot:216552-Pelagomonas_calceolata.AAC.3
MTRYRALLLVVALSADVTFRLCACREALHAHIHASCHFHSHASSLADAAGVADHRTEAGLRLREGAWWAELVGLAPLTSTACIAATCTIATHKVATSWISYHEELPDATWGGKKTAGRPNLFLDFHPAPSQFAMVPSGDMTYGSRGTKSFVSFHSSNAGG